LVKKALVLGSLQKIVLENSLVRKVWTTCGRWF